MAWRGRLRSWTGADLLAAVASIAFVAGVALAFVASDLSLAAGIPLWNVVLVVSMLAVLASVFRFPEWWAWAGGWGPNGRACAGARARRASHTVDLCQARSPRVRQRPVVPGAHSVARSVEGSPRAGRRRRSQADWLLAARRRDSMPRLQGQHGRSRD